MNQEQYKKYCDVLEVAVDASVDTIKSAYKDLVSVWHPDRFENKEHLQQKATEKLKCINEARDSLLTYISNYGVYPFTTKAAAKSTSPLITIRSGKKYGFINVDGEIVIDPIYEQAIDYPNGYASVKQNNKWGLIDPALNMIFDHTFEYPITFDAAVGYYRHNGKLIVFSPEFKTIITDHDECGIDINECCIKISDDDSDKYYRINGQRVDIYGCDFDVDTYGMFNYELIPVKDLRTDPVKIGFMNMNGNVTIYPEYYIVTDFIQGLSVVLTDATKRFLSSKVTFCWQVINTDNLKLTGMIEMSQNKPAEGVSDGIVVFGNSSSSAFYDLSNGKLYDLDFDLELFKGGISAIRKFNKNNDEYECGVITKDGRYVFIDDAESFITNLGEGYFKYTTKGGKQTCLDKNMNVIVPPIYKYITFNKNHFICQSDSKYAVVNINGDVIYTSYIS